MDKVAIVTGGAQGIGKATLRALLQQGWRVAFFDHDQQAGAETAQEYAGLGPVSFLPVDVADDAAMAAAIGRVAQQQGRLDLLVNNAGVFESRPLEQQDYAGWRRVLSINLDGAWLGARHAAPHLRKQRGSIINIGSTRAHMSEPGTEAYAASKGGLLALTHALALSLGPEVRVNCISPGWIDVSAWKKSGVREPESLRPIDHAQHPAGRVGRPEDVAALVLFLAGDEAGFITGQEFVVDGGMTRKMIYA